MENKPISNIENLKVINDLRPQRSEYESNYHCKETWKCAFSPNDQLFAYSSGNKTVILVNWFDIVRKRTDDNDLNGNKYLRIDCNHLVRSLNFSLIANLQKSTAFWLRTAQFKEYFLITGHLSGRIRFWDVISGKLLLELLDHRDAVSDIVSTPYGILASTSLDGTLKIWDLMDGGNLLKSIKTGGKPLYACRWSPDLKSLVTVGMSITVDVWDASSYSKRLSLKAHQHNVVSCDFSPDSCLIVTVSWDTRVIIWNANTGHILRQFKQLKPEPSLIYAGGENGNFIRSVAFCPDGAHIATVADDGILRIWDILNDEEPESIGNVTHGLYCTYSRSGQVIAVGTRAGSVTIFEAKSCVKSLLFLSRLAIRRRIQSKSINAKLDSIPKLLLDYLDYKELT